MGVPATTGVLRTKIEDMEIGDYIKYQSSNAYGNMAIGTDVTSTTEAPTTGNAYGTATISFSYMTKVAKGLLICDRVIIHTTKWDDLNAFKFIQGQPMTLNNTAGIIRSLTGGVAYADANGNSSTTDKGFGAFPTNNEWDRYIVNFPTDKIQSGKTLDDVFHWNGIFTTTQDTPSILMPSSSSTTRMGRGRISDRTMTYFLSSVSDTLRGFRPVFEYQEV